MLRKIFRCPVRTVEVIEPSKRRQTMSHDEYVSQSIAKNRLQAELLWMGLRLESQPEHLREHVERR